MKLFIVLFLIIIFISPSSYACRGPTLEDKLFFHPAVNSGYFIGVVKIQNKNNKNPYKVEANGKIIENFGESIHKRKNIKLIYQETSCGPHEVHGNKGLIVGKIIEETENLLTVEPLMTRDHDWYQGNPLNKEFQDKDCSVNQ